MFSKPCYYVTPWDYLAGFAVGGDVRLESLQSQPVFRGVWGAQGRWCKVVSEVERGSEEEKGGLFFPV